MPTKPSVARYRIKRLAALDALPKQPCACGCGTMIRPKKWDLTPQRFAHGHHARGNQHGKGKTPWNKRYENQNQVAQAYRERQRARRLALDPVPCACGCGTLICPIRSDNGKPTKFAKGHNASETLARWRWRKGNLPWNTGQIGADSHCWKGGVGNLPYGPEFTKPLKQYIRARDNHTCQRCGKTQADEGRVLVVHHLDHDKMNNAPENLVAACQKCNVWASHHRDAPFVRSAICA